MIRNWEVYLHAESLNLNIQTEAGWETLRLDVPQVPHTIAYIEDILRGTFGDVSFSFPAGPVLVPRQMAAQWMVALESALRQWDGEQLTDEDIIARMEETVEPKGKGQ